MHPVKTSIAIAACAAIVPAAAGNVVLSFGYTDLDGNYDGAGQFTATAGANTSGDVTRLEPSPSSTANFDSNFAALSGTANATFNIDVTNIRPSMDSTGREIADGAGDFELVDADGDRITGDISGTWFEGFAGFIFFNGFLDNVMIDDVSADTTFDGTDGGSFSTAFTPAPDLGALINLTFSTAGFFDGAFSNSATLIDGEILPSPGAGLLLGTAGLALARRRR